MKKTLVSALTTALVVGAASTTFAASNPFSDVPSDHWAYDAVSQLAADGIIDGYGDSTFQGSKNITRYEMAQMVAKAMAKNPSGVDKALVDKLAAEFADELNNLGVRVANLERNADMVKWNGTAEYTWQNWHYKNGLKKDGSSRNEGQNNVLFRLEPSAEVNANWHVNARLDANSNLKTDEGEESANVKLKRVWAEGNYGKFTAKLGKFAPIDNDSIVDTTFSGAEVSYGDQLKFTAGAGRMNMNDDKNIAEGLTGETGKKDAANYQYYGLDYSLSKFNAGAHFHHLNQKNFNYSDDKQTDQANIWKLSAGYNFDGVSALNTFYAKNNDAVDQTNAWAAEYSYKGAEAENKGSWGAWLAYRRLGYAAVIANTYDVVKPGLKGWEIGADYTLFKNVVLTGRYGWNKDLSNGEKAQSVFGRVNFFF